MATAFEIGVAAWALGQAGSGASLADQAAFAESLGFHSFWLPENHFGDVNSLPAPLLLLAAASAKTSRIRLGTGSYLLPIRHPVQASHALRPAIFEEKSKRAPALPLVLFLNSLLSRPLVFRADIWRLPIPADPPTYSDGIRPPVPGYPPTCGVPR